VSQDEHVEFETLTRVTVSNITAGRRSSPVSLSCSTEVEFEMVPLVTVTAGPF
jgi:hypothetical protein